MPSLLCSPPSCAPSLLYASSARTVFVEGVHVDAVVDESGHHGGLSQHGHPVQKRVLLGGSSEGGRGSQEGVYPSRNLVQNDNRRRKP